MGNETLPKNREVSRANQADQHVRCTSCRWHGDTLDLFARDGDGWVLCPECGNSTIVPDNSLYHNFEAMSDMVGDLLNQGSKR